jgi:hypothetical protein
MAQRAEVARWPRLWSENPKMYRGKMARATVTGRERQMFRKFALTFALLAAAAIPLGSSAEAAIGEGVVASHMQMQLPIEDAAFV